MKEIVFKHFSVIEDTRCQCDIDHKLVDVLVLIMCATLCGVEELEEIVAYGKSKFEFLERYFGITKIPSESTLSRILNMISAEEIGLCIVNIMKEMLGTDGEIIAIDGKTICSTDTKFNQI